VHCRTLPAKRDSVSGSTPANDSGHSRWCLPVRISARTVVGYRAARHEMHRGSVSPVPFLVAGHRGVCHAVRRHWRPMRRPRLSLDRGQAAVGSRQARAHHLAYRRRSTFLSPEPRPDAISLADLPQNGAADETQFTHRVARLRSGRTFDRRHGG